MTLYKNGHAVGSNAAGHEPTATQRSKCYLGKSNWAGDGYFQGALAEQLKSASLNLKSKAGRTHSNDEGLF